MITWEAILQRTIQSYCNDPHHDSRWCSTCNTKEDTIDSIIDDLQLAMRRGECCLNPLDFTETRQAINDVLQKRIKVIGGNEQTYTGYPVDLINEVSLVISKLLKGEGRMAKFTVNEAMVLAKAIRGRYAELSSMRSANSNRETYYATANEPKRVVEPTYDVKDIDRRCVELENFLLQVESKIKQSNAMTVIEVDADVKLLLAPLA